MIWPFYRLCIKLQASLMERQIYVSLFETFVKAGRFIPLIEES